MKDHLRDYATEAFRYYARCGCPTYQQMRDKIYADALESERKELVRSGNIAKPTEYAVMAAEKAVDNRKGELLDILAIERVMRILDGSPGELLMQHSNPMYYYIKQAVKIVYFTGADKPLRKGEISERVHKASLRIPASERQIYYWLAKARRIFAEERELRLYNKLPEKFAVQGVKKVV